MKHEKIKSFIAGLILISVIALFFSLGVLIGIKENRHRYDNEIARLKVLKQLVANEAEKNNRKFIALNHELTLLQKSTNLIAQINSDLLRLYLYNVESADPSVLTNLDRNIIFPQNKLLKIKSLSGVPETIVAIDTSYGYVNILPPKKLSKTEM